ncbi:MAG TPA: undecaprenyl-phosphate glucose phosphotransferase [Kiritimatiellia bacterium]|nr:undecaprenyl-phosphate glucose phosphotransferase [Kiritimatiellia bacterium]
MRNRDTFDVFCKLAGIAADALAVFGGFLLAVWLRFDSGWVPLLEEGVPPREMYEFAGVVLTLLMLFIFQTLELYERPQLGSFSEKIPRLVRAIGIGIFIGLALAFVVKTDPPMSRLTMLMSMGTISLLVLVERYVMFKVELALARRQAVSNRVVVLGTDEVAARLKGALEKEPRLRTKVVAFLAVGETARAEEVPEELVGGSLEVLEGMIARGEVDRVILANMAAVSHDRMAEIILECERAMIPFNFVPDLFRILTIAMDVQSIDGIPVLGTRKWPLDYFWNRVWKRLEDVVGASVGLVVSAPVIAVAAWLIRRSSPGPVFFAQERCGERGETFTIYKLRTMKMDAEVESGPVWAVENDPRRTKVGAFLREYNLDELPQFWNVLRGDMSLVGPRPERPHFVEQFKEEISRYMWRHAFRPGMTGWAQVNGLRGNTSIAERSKYDLYYLENWSLAFDFKIIARTLFSRKNAY